MAPAPGAEAPVVPPQFQPNFKFKVLDKEHEIEEMFRGLIKDAETEKKIKEMHEKAYGLEPVKQQRDQFREKARTTETRLNEINESLAEVGSFVKKDDFDSFFNALKIPEQKIFQWVLNKINYQQLPPEQRAIYDSQRQAQQQAYELERQNQQLAQQYQEQASQSKALELQMVMQRPDVQSVAESFDARVGRPGAFQEEVVRRGQLAWYQNRKDLTAEEAVREVLALHGNPVGAAAPQAQAPQAQTPPAVAARPPVIPNVAGKTTSPVRQAVKSLADIRKISEQL